MKKLILGIFNIFIYVCLIYSVLVVVYYALPTEIQDKAPQINSLFLLVSGGSTLILGSVPLMVKTYLGKNNVEVDGKLSALTHNYLQVVDILNKINDGNKLKSVDDLKTQELLIRSNKLAEIELRSRLDNDFISDKIKLEIEGVLDEKI